MPILIDGKVKLTYEDYLRLPDDGLRHEIIDGEHFVSPSAVPYHQKVSRRIQFQLYRAIEETGRGEVYDAPTDLHLSEVDVLVPDLLALLAPKLGLIGPKKIEGAPDLVIEITSPGSARRDRGIKRAVYERAGVPEYWVVDPKKKVVERHLLREGKYVLDGTHSDEVAFGGLPDLAVDLRKVW
jgi:Uma2 family endonuclease